MHEMSLTTGLLDIVREEMRKHGASRLVLVRLRCGVLANVVPEALSMAFEVLTEGTDLEGARLDMVEEALRLACGKCGQEYSPEASPSAVFSPCPFCGEEIGHRVLAGRELYIEHLEVDS